ncbi:hypothetical protein [Conchiformibius steedae]|uniref:hypothetical protein n=1 Tax=Conchiformibius steedae TaxID=153493 RepID=UPI00163AFCDC|nr:hypothetical protein [Conchiformibius steedae]
MEKQTIPVWLGDFLRYFQVPGKPSVAQAYEAFARKRAENGEAVPDLAEVEAVIGTFYR